MVGTLIKNIAQALDKEKIPYMLIGGQAVLLYGRPRFTKDIDITLGVDTDDYPRIEKLCKKLKLKIIPKNPKVFVRQTNVLPAKDSKSKIRVDFIFSYTPYERQAIHGANSVKVKGYAVRFAAIEDVIIHKMFAGRALDMEDVKSMLIKNKERIDLRYIKKWLRRFSQMPGQEKILQNFNKILRQKY